MLRGMKRCAWHLLAVASLLLAGGVRAETETIDLKALAKKARPAVLLLVVASRTSGLSKHRAAATLRNVKRLGQLLMSIVLPLIALVSLTKSSAETESVDLKARVKTSSVPQPLNQSANAGGSEAQAVVDFLTSLE